MRLTSLVPSLYGVSCSQMYYYFTSYSKDPWGLKLLVIVVWLSDSAHQALISHSVYWYLVTEYGNPVALTLLTRTIIAEVFFGICTGFFVQSFFVVRIWHLSGKKLAVVIPVAILVLGEFSVGMAYSIKAVSFTTFLEDTRLKSLSIATNAFAAAGDVTIAVLMCKILHDSRTGFSKSDTLINKLMMFSVNTGILTSICACLSLITILAMPNTFVYITFFFLLGRVYSNTLMATLNARKSLREASGGDLSLSLRDMQPTVPSNLSISNRRTGDIAIHIDTTHESKHDIESQYGGSLKRPVESV
ncbi:hypothetical protein C2E23DRAFT_91919 [Lenzites betulinus]|nr:hypothetical protein C2E23DRAFT_91919 [Lenzites betulinus]